MPACGSAARALPPELLMWHAALLAPGVRLPAQHVRATAARTLSAALLPGRPAASLLPLPWHELCSAQSVQQPAGLPGHGACCGAVCGCWTAPAARGSVSLPDFSVVGLPLQGLPAGQSPAVMWKEMGMGVGHRPHQ